MEKSTFQCDGEGFSSRVYFPDGDARGTVLMCHAWAGQSHFERARHGKAHMQVKTVISFHGIFAPLAQASTYLG